MDFPRPQNRLVKPENLEAWCRWSQGSKASSTVNSNLFLLLLVVHVQYNTKCLQFPRLKICGIRTILRTTSHYCWASSLESLRAFRVSENACRLLWAPTFANYLPAFRLMGAHFGSRYYHTGMKIHQLQKLNDVIAWTSFEPIGSRCALLEHSCIDIPVFSKKDLHVWENLMWTSIVQLEATSSATTPLSRVQDIYADSSMQ